MDHLSVEGIEAVNRRAARFFQPRNDCPQVFGGGEFWCVYPRCDCERTGKLKSEKE